MPSIHHEAPLLLLRNAPELVPRLLEESLGVRIPPFAEARAESSDLGEAAPVERRADLVLTFRDARGALIAAVVLEVQRQVDELKRFSWPEYVANLHGRSRCPTWLLVLSDDRRVVAWARRGVDSFQPNVGFLPLVIGPDDFPSIVDREAAKAEPELAVLSALMRRESPDAVGVARAALVASLGLDDERARRYLDLIFATLPEIAKQALEALMETDKSEYQSEFARKYFAEGIEQGLEQGLERGMVEELKRSLATVITARGMALDDPHRARLESEPSADQLRRWLERAAVASKLEEIFAAS